MVAGDRDRDRWCVLKRDGWCDGGGGCRDIALRGRLWDWFVERLRGVLVPATAPPTAPSV